MCDQKGHKASDCAWVYTICKYPKCGGIRKISTSHTSRNPGRKYLSCQFGHCPSNIEWLDEAIVAIPRIEGCFKCGEEGHWMKECPWMSLECQSRGCNSKRVLRTSQSQQSQGLRYLKCLSCGHFQWLNDARIERERTTRNGKEATISIEVKLSDFCNAFSATRI